MGFLEDRMKKRLIKRWKSDPGGPAMTAKAMASAYERFQAENPAANHQELMRLALAQRGEISDALPPATQKKILELAGGKFHRLVEEIIMAESPPGLSSELTDSGFYGAMVVVIMEALNQSGVPLEG